MPNNVNIQHTNFISGLEVNGNPIIEHIINKIPIYVKNLYNFIFNA